MLLRRFDPLSWLLRRPRWVLRAPCLLALALAALLFVPVRGDDSPAPAVTGVESVGLVVSDLERAIDFFTRVLTFEVVTTSEEASAERERLEGVFGLRVRTARLRLGQELLDLSEYLAPRGRPVPPDSRSNDCWFQHVAIITNDMAAAYARLREHRVEHASSGPQRLPDWNPNAGGIEAFYFKDPDGHSLEVLQFPPGKGDPRWHGAAGKLFLGIDHTAIVVGDTERSLALYRDVLGFRVAGASENHGVEQEHLNNVFGARLRITALRANGGPGIELLEYLSPAGGRRAPEDTRSCDLIAWQTRIVVRDLARLEADLLRARAQLVSPGRVSGAERGTVNAEALVARDPDGHALKLIQNVSKSKEAP